MDIQSISDFRRAMRHGPYAWPGGYQCYFVMADGETLSFEAAKACRRDILQSFAMGWHNNGWRPIALEINWEEELYCVHTGKPIPASYGIYRKGK